METNLLKTVLLVNRGELGRKALEKNILIRALEIAEPDDFEDVQIVTLAQWAEDHAVQQAFEEVEGGEIPNNRFLSRVGELKLNEYKTGKEFVRVFENGDILVGLNIPMVDLSSTDKALELLIQIEEFKPGTLVEFGEEVPICDSQYP